MKNQILKNKNVLITGGANGIGKAIVEECIAEGAKVFIFDVDKKNMIKVCKDTGAKGYVVDISDHKQNEKIFKTRELNNIDVLICDAAINTKFNTTNLNFDIWDKVLKTNLYGHFSIANFVIKNIIKRKVVGSIIFITSVHTSVTFSNYTAYDTSKHGLIGLMRVLALDLAKYNIRCNCVAPGLIYPTKMTSNLTKKELQKLSRCIPMKRHGNPHEVAKVVTFLASDLSSYVNGVEINVDGGLGIQNAIDNY